MPGILSPNSAIPGTYYRAVGDQATASVFMSYVTDETLVRAEVGSVLSDLGFQVLDLARREGNSEWRRSFLAKLDRCCALVVLVGERTYRSEPIRWELAEATLRGTPVAAVRVRPGNVLPRGLDVECVVDYEDGGDRARLQHALSGWRTRPELEVLS